MKVQERYAPPSASAEVGHKSESSTSHLLQQSLSFSDRSLFRYYLIASLLSNKSINLKLPTRIQTHEANFLHFLSRLTSGTKFEVSPDGRSVAMRPGVVEGGTLTHTCCGTRGLGYWVEAACILCPFAKSSTEITLTSVVTNHSLDLGIDVLRTVTLPLLRKFGVECSLKLIQRSILYNETNPTPSRDSTASETESRGKVVLTIQNVRFLHHIQLTHRGKVKKVRGIAYGLRVAPDVCNRMATGAKGRLLPLLSDVYVVTDVGKGGQTSMQAPSSSSSSAGFGICLVTESTTKEATCTAEVVAQRGQVAEEIATECADELLDQIARAGCVDVHHVGMCVFLMVLSQSLPSQVRVGGEISPRTRRVMNSVLKSFFGVAFSVVEDTSDERSAIITCVGIKLLNSSKRSS